MRNPKQGQRLIESVMALDFERFPGDMRTAPKNPGQWTNYVSGALVALMDAMGYDQYGGKKIGGGGYSGRAVRSLRALLPYCLHPVDAEGKTLIWLNRDYKPLGVLPYGVLSRYEEYPQVHISADDPALQAVMSRAKEAPVFRDAGSIWFLFDDATSPWSSKANALRLNYLLIEILAEADSTYRKKEVASA